MKDEFKRINSEDLVTIRKMAKENNVTLETHKFRNPDYIIQMGFFRENDTIQEKVPFYFAHWYMSMVTLDMITNAVIELSSTLMNYYDLYKSETSTVNERKLNFNRFVRTWQDFYGYVINIKQSSQPAVGKYFRIL